MNYSKLPADPSSLILAIVSLVIGIAGCCCYGILALVPLVLAIIGLVMANNSIREYNSNPGVYSPQSRNNVGTAKVINIIAVVFNGVIVLFFVIFFVLYGTLFSAAILEDIRNANDPSYNDYRYENDGYNWEDDEYDMEEEVDSVNVDTIAPIPAEEVIEIEDSNGPN